MKIIDNSSTTLKDDLEQEIKKGSKIDIAAAYFSIYAYEALKSKLQDIEELRFIFTSPTFIKEKADKAKREFYIPRLSRERSLYGTEFELRIRNKLTQKAIAQECADWIKRKAKFKSNNGLERMSGYINIKHSNNTSSTYQPIQGFDTVDLGLENGDNNCNIITKIDTEHSIQFLNRFNQVWNDKELLQDVSKQVLENITTAYKENPAEYLYFVALYNIFHEFLNDINEDIMPQQGIKYKDSLIWNKLYDFQKNAFYGIINRLEKYNGCILADSVGLGKTFTALAVIKYYQERNRDVLVLCPKKLSSNWTTYTENYVNNPFHKDRFNYTVLFHTDLSRKKGKSGRIEDLSRFNWGNFGLLVIDESHNFRNGKKINEKGDANRYLNLMNKVIRQGIPTKVLMLSATPVNLEFTDLKRQIELIDGIDEKLNTNKSIDTIFRQAQEQYNKWMKLPQEKRTTQSLLEMLDFDFFDLLDNITIARSRKHIRDYYDMSAIGSFPERQKPVSTSPELTDLNISGLNYDSIYDLLTELNLSVYTPSRFLLPSKKEYYEEKINDGNITRSGREEGMQKLMYSLLLKRLESSCKAFSLTLNRIQNKMEDAIKQINDYEKIHISSAFTNNIEGEDWDIEDSNMDVISATEKVKIEDMDYVSWRNEIEADLRILQEIANLINKITPEHDTKLKELIEKIKNKQANPINGNNKKVLVFTAFADTAQYLYDNITKAFPSVSCGLITGEGAKSTLCKKYASISDIDTILTFFSPVSKERDVIFPDETIYNIDILIATDCVSEGQNLQDCDYCINYDIHWNPVRIIQRFGRIDRIGSKNKTIQMVNFWPPIDLDKYLRLIDRVKGRMAAGVLASTGDDNPINPEEKELEYRKKQLEQLKNEIVDIEDLNGGISIMDLGLNDFRQDLLAYIKDNPQADMVPNGLHAVLEHTETCPEGVIFILRNVNKGVNIDNKNILHPFYMVYIGSDGQIIENYLKPKQILDKLRLLCKGKLNPNEILCKNFNKETSDGTDMSKYSDLLSKAIKSIINVKEETDKASIFSAGGTSFFGKIKGIEDFELICFFVIK